MPVSPMKHGLAPVTTKLTERAPPQKGASPQPATRPADARRVSAQADRFEAGGTTPVQKRIDAAATSKAWKTHTPVIKQTTPDNCGPAAVAMLTRSAGTYNEKSLSDKELVRQLGNGFVNRTAAGGVSVNDMGRMMSTAGLVVDKAASPKPEEVVGFMHKRLQAGQKMVALLDGHTLEGVKGAGVSPHWVVIDGLDNKGRFVVKDPALGKALSVDGATIRASLEKGRLKGSSGLLAVEPKNQFGVERGHGLELAAAGKGLRPVRNGSGIGSRVATSSTTREST